MHKNLNNKIYTNVFVIFFLREQHRDLYNCGSLVNLYVVEVKYNEL